MSSTTTEGEAGGCHGEAQWGPSNRDRGGGRKGRRLRETRGPGTFAGLWARPRRGILGLGGIIVRVPSSMRYDAVGGMSLSVGLLGSSVIMRAKAAGGRKNARPGRRPVPRCRRAWITTARNAKTHNVKPEGKLGARFSSVRLGTCSRYLRGDRVIAMIHLISVAG